jgi:HAMP domain-containing protein
VVAAEADLSFLWEEIGKIQFGSAGYGYLVDENGNLIAHKEGSLVLKKMKLAQLDKVSEFLRNPKRSDINPAREGRGLMDTQVLATYAPVPGLGWAVILEEPVDAALANVEKLKRYAVVLLLMALIIGAAVIVWLSSRMVGPISELHRGAKIIGSGNLDYRVDIKTGDEIEWLGGEFNKMAEELNVSYATLEQKVKDKTHELEEANSELEEVNRSLVKANI